MLEQLEAPSGKVYGVLKAFGLLKSLEGGLAEHLPDETLDALLALQAKAAKTVEDLTADVVKTALSDESGQTLTGADVRHLTRAQASEQIGLVEKVLVQVNGIFIADVVRECNDQYNEERAIKEFVNRGFWGERWKSLPEEVAAGLPAEDGMFIMEDIQGAIAKIQSGRSRRGELKTSSKRGSEEVETVSALPQPPS